jgi:arginyl-tRNA synthetase
MSPALLNELREACVRACHTLFNPSSEQVFQNAWFDLSPTRKEFEGDVTLVVFPFVKMAGASPEQTAGLIGAALLNAGAIEKYNVVKGFLNLTLPPSKVSKAFSEALEQNDFGLDKSGSRGLSVVEYSSPNTNKPLHLGHVRNILLGHSVSELLANSGYQVTRTSLVNDRGVHICKSMLAYQWAGGKDTPESMGMKGDHLVGHFYVAFDQVYKQECRQLFQELCKAHDLTAKLENPSEELKALSARSNDKKSGLSAEEKTLFKQLNELQTRAENEAPAMQQAREMLRKWEAGDAETLALWSKMNAWVYEGFDVTYRSLGARFDTFYYESNTYKLGKDLIEEGVAKGVFYKKEDRSAWLDLRDEGLDEKCLLRSDGTALYMTQDIGTAVERQKDLGFSQLIYVVGNEQDYHFKVLFRALQKLGYSWANHLHHLSYGMVELPEGKMKSREGTVVDADDLIAEMLRTAEEITTELGKTADLEIEEKKALFKAIGLSALKYFILKVDPKKKMLFNPRESIDFHGNTGPFILYTYARIQSIFRKLDTALEPLNQDLVLNQAERDLLLLNLRFPVIREESAQQMNPAHLANYIYDLAKAFNGFYHDYQVLKEEDPQVRNHRLQLCRFTANNIKNSMHLLGIDVVDRM